MPASLRIVLTFCLIGGLGATLFAGFAWVEGAVYWIASTNERSSVGEIVKIESAPREGTLYDYKFNVNGVKVQDYSDVCDTSFGATSCIVGGRVLVYYSYQPFSNSRLEDFSAASHNAIQRGNRRLAIGLLLVGIYAVAEVVWRRSKRRDGPERDENADENSPADDPEDAISITPRD